MINRIAVMMVLLLTGISCGGDDMENEEENACGGEVSLVVDGAFGNFGTPTSATLVDLNFESGTELLIVWTRDGKTVNLQAVIDETNVACFPSGRLELGSLPSNVSLLSFQYFDINGSVSSVSNIFAEDGGDGWIDVKSCDGESDKISVDFGFNAVSLNGDLVSVTGGSAVDVCFDRTK